MSAATPMTPIEQALDDYTRQNGQRLARLCASLAGESAAAEDLAQETLIEVWRLRERVHDVETLPRWVAGVARDTLDVLSLRVS